MGNTVFIENEGRLWPKSLAWANLSPTKRAKIPRGIDVPAIIADPHPRVSARAKVFKFWRYGIRTPGLVIANDALYQLSYTPAEGRTYHDSCFCQPGL